MKNMKKKSNNTISKFVKLSNNQWLKVELFRLCKNDSIWRVAIVVANSKRECNDCFHKSEMSPKVFYGDVSGNKLGVEALLKAKNTLKEMEKELHRCFIRITPVNDRLFDIYFHFLKKEGYKAEIITNSIYGKGKKRLYKYLY